MKKAMFFAAVLSISCAVGAGAQTGYTVLHNFAGPPGDGEEPAGRLTADGDTLYGSAYYGGANNKGALFSLGKDGSSYTVLDSFDGTNTGTWAHGGLVPVNDPNFGLFLYGTAGWQGTNGKGTLFFYNFLTGITSVHNFPENATDGESPMGGLVMDGSLLYGVTGDGGTYGGGTVFSFDPADPSTTYTIIHNFGGVQLNGAYPDAGLLLDGGTLYGMTSQGGDKDNGTVFSMKTDGSGFTTLHSFQGSPDDGSSPAGALVSDGSRLYGATHEGGVTGTYAVAGYGVVFSLDPSDPAGSYTVLHRFTGKADDAGQPAAGLAIAGGMLYGVSDAGAADMGALYSLAKDGTGFTVVHRFAGPPGDGSMPDGALISDGSTLYGTTRYGGKYGSGYGCGTIFSLPVPANYVELTASPAQAQPGGTVSMGWSCDPSGWNYSGVPVDIYVAAIKKPTVVDGPSSTATALGGSEVYLAADKMASWYRYTRSVGAPTWSGVVFPGAPTSGSKQVTLPTDSSFKGDWVFATAFMKADGSGPVRTDPPVENSNVFSIQ